MTPPPEVPPRYKPSLVPEVTVAISSKLGLDAHVASTVFRKETSQRLADACWFEAAGDVVQGICDKARYADLIIVGQYEWQGFPETHPLPIAHSVVLQCGRPVLVVPAVVQPRALARIAVAWDGSREAVRAVHDALPLLHLSQSVQIVKIIRIPTEDNDIDVKSLSDHLANHGIQVESQAWEISSVKEHASLRKQIEEGHYDMVVMGGYSHPMWLEFHLWRRHSLDALVIDDTNTCLTLVNVNCMRVPPNGANRSQRTKALRSYLARLKEHPLARVGPGLITGVADDDPSGIATYSQAGAQFGLSMLWTMPLCFPLMAAIQLMCADIGRVTGKGLAANIKSAFPPIVLQGVVLLLLIANTLNIAADVAAMGEVSELVTGLDRHLMTVVFVLGTLLLQIFVPYHRYVFFLKWLTLSLLAYAAVLFTVHVPWGEVALRTFLPKFTPNAEAATVVVGVFGTTISPYLFFWQASEEVEDMQMRHGAALLGDNARAAEPELRRIR